MVIILIVMTVIGVGGFMLMTAENRTRRGQQKTRPGSATPPKPERGPDID